MGNQIYHPRYNIPRSTALDSELQTFDAGLRQRTGRVLGSIAKGVDENRSVSFASLKALTCGLLDMDQEVLKIILESKDDVWANKELFLLVEEYFETSLKTLDFCVSLEKAARRARDEQLILRTAIASLVADRGEYPSDSTYNDDSVPGEGRYEQIMEELRTFRLKGSPFGEEIAVQFRSVYQRHVEMQSKLRSQKKKLDKKLRYVKGWTKVSSVILAATCAALLICSVIAAVIAVPPIASAVSALPLEAMGRWFKSLGGGYEHRVRARRDLVRDMYVSTFFTLKELDTIRVLVDRLEEEIDRMVRSIQFGERHTSAAGPGLPLSFVVEQIRRQQSDFMAELERFEKHIELCNEAIFRARTVVLQRIIHHRSSSS